MDARVLSTGDRTRPERTDRARRASATNMMATSGTALPASESVPQEVQKPTFSDPIIVVDAQAGQVQAWSVMTGVPVEGWGLKEPDAVSVS